MQNYRRESLLVRVLRFAWFALGAVVALGLLKQAATMYGAPTSALWRYREPPTPPHLFVRGRLRRRPGETLPPLCNIAHERLKSCGKTRCWTWVEGMVSARGVLDVEWSSSPLPKSVSFAAKQHFEPVSPVAQPVTGERATTWKHVAQAAGLGFSDASLASSNDRITEACIGEGEPVFVEACTPTSTPGQLEPCPGMTQYGVIAGEPQSALDAAADGIALRIAGAFLALLVGVLGLIGRSTPLSVGLEDRAAPHRRGLGWTWSLLAIPPLAGMFDLLSRAYVPPSTWATGRDGFTVGIGALALWVLFACSRVLHRNRSRAALAPVLATPRSLLAEASGTVELAVRARLRNGGVRTLIGDDAVAFSEVKLFETYRHGKNTSTVERFVHRATDELEVVDESGDGVLHLAGGVLDVELRKVTMKDLSPRYAERGIVPERHVQHVSYTVEERVIHDGEPLYVFGEVTAIAPRSNELAYRAVRGAPTLGGAGVPPVLVYGGDERGLLTMLTSTARTANSFAVVSGFVCVALVAALGYLASL